MRCDARSAPAICCIYLLYSGIEDSDEIRALQKLWSKITDFQNIEKSPIFKILAQSFGEAVHGCVTVSLMFLNIQHNEKPLAIATTVDFTT